jgi:cytochrome c
MKRLHKRIPKRIAAMLASTLPLLVWLPAAQAGDALHGGKLFEEECAECHSAKPGKNKKGPTLFSVAGRSAGSVPDYVYSDAMKSSGVSWTADRLDAYIAAPRKLIPGCKMKYDGLSDASARADLIEFLHNTR